MDSQAVCTISPASIDAESMFRNEYIAWAKSQGKAMDEAHFQIVMLQMQDGKKTVEFHDLNEHGDMTEIKYRLPLDQSHREHFNHLQW